MSILNIILLVVLVALLPFAIGYGFIGVILWLIAVLIAHIATKKK